MKVVSRVIFNTGVLYFQLILGLVVGLFTTRIVLNALGEIDYGIYILVAGLVGMLGILNSNMSNTSMRYLAHSLGGGDEEKMIKTFNTTLFLHFVFGGIVVIIMAIFGWIMFEYFLNIPNGKILDAQLIFIFMVITTLITVISVPYEAVMNAHENILALSLVEVLGNILKLGVAVYLTYSQYNLLIIYGFLMLVVQVVLRIIKQLYSKAKYKECKIRFRQHVDKELMKSILTFTGWNLFGSLGSLAVTQVKGLLLNMFFGVKLNAAEGVSRNASTAVGMVSTNLTRALNPQLIMSEGGGNREKLIRITQIGTKFSSFLFAMFAVPVFIEAPYLLKLWLRDVPEFATIFFRLILISMFIESFTFQITEAIRAVGKIKTYILVESFLYVLTIPLAYAAFKLDFNPSAIYIIGVMISPILLINRLYFGKCIVGLDVQHYILGAIIPVLIPIIFSTFLTVSCYFLLPESIFRLSLVMLIFMSSLAISFWFLGLQSEERLTLKLLIFSIVVKIKRIV